MDDRIIVSSFGIHVHGGTPYLHQGREGTDALGHGSVSPFVVQSGRACPHAIDITNPRPAVPPPKGFLNNPLVDMYLPKPVLESGEARLGYIVAQGLSCFPSLTKLAALGSATDDAVRVWGTGQERRICDVELRLTNLVPLTLIGFRPEDDAVLARIVEFAQTQKRRLIVTIDEFVPRPPGASDLTGALAQLQEQLAVLDKNDLRNLGAAFFAQYMQKLTEKMYYGSSS